MIKYKVLGWLREFGGLSLMDNVKFTIKRVTQAASNRRFESENPDFPVPPYALAFDAYNMIDWYTYKEVGLKHAGVFTDIIKKNVDSAELAIMEWGCGPGRLIRHIADLLPNKKVSVTGTDYNPETIRWCKQALPKIRFIDNDILPPVKLADASFDVIYNFSVFTHLSEEAQVLWASELHRLLKPGGVLICTTHGKNYMHLLTTTDELKRYEQGETVVQGGYAEGKKWYLAIHPDQFVKNKLLASFTNVHKFEVSPESSVLQDFWVAKKAS